MPSGDLAGGREIVRKRQPIEVTTERHAELSVSLDPCGRMPLPSEPVAFRIVAIRVREHEVVPEVELVRVPRYEVSGFNGRLALN